MLIMQLRISTKCFLKVRHDRGTQTAKDPMTSETEKLSFDIVFFALGKRNANSGEQKAKTYQTLPRFIYLSHLLPRKKKFTTNNLF
jgi:hypothetical protein